VQLQVLGPSGVGKTTTLRAAEALRADPPEWLAPAEADALVPRAMSARARGEGVNHEMFAALVDGCVDVLSRAHLRPSQKIAALTILRESCYKALMLHRLHPHLPVVHDELVLNRAFSVLTHSSRLERDATWFFETAPLPDRAVVMRAEPSTLVSRVLERGTRPNVYLFTDDAQLPAVVARALEVATVAAGSLAARGVPVLTLELGDDTEASARALHEAAVGGPPTA
jgi:hypothetical protein